MKIIVATNNQGKLKEIKKLINVRANGRLPLQLLCLSDIDTKIKIIENGKTFRENAIKKAVITAKKLHMTAIADDSGLCVDALKGGPGVKSARFVRPPATSDRLCIKLLKTMKSLPCGKRGAKFVCCVAIATPEGKMKTAEGICKGTITQEMSGSGGFGYDPVFIPDGQKRTFAQMPLSKKNIISHRGKAFVKAREILDLIAAKGSNK